MPPGNSSGKSQPSQPKKICKYCRRKSCEGQSSHLPTFSIPTLQRSPPINRVSSTGPTSVVPPRREKYVRKPTSEEVNVHPRNLVRLGPTPYEVKPNEYLQNIGSTSQPIIGSSSNILPYAASVVQDRTSHDSKTTIEKVSSPSLIKVSDVHPNNSALEQNSGSTPQSRNEPSSETPSSRSSAVWTSDVATFSTTKTSHDKFTPVHHPEVSGAIPKKSTLKNGGNDEITISVLPNSGQPNERNRSTSNLGEVTPSRPLDSLGMGKELISETVSFGLPSISQTEFQPNQNLKAETEIGNATCNKTDDKKLQNFDRSINTCVIKQMLPAETSSKIHTGKKFENNSDFVWVKEVTHESQTKKQHSHKAVKYEGVVEQILDHRAARVKVAERNGRPIVKSQWGSADAVHKFAQLFVNKLQPSILESSYPSDRRMSSVLRKGEVIFLICTEHNTPKLGFDLFAHKAWKVVNEGQQNNYGDVMADTHIPDVRDSVDAESVASTCSQTGSDTQQSISSSSRRKRRGGRNRKNNAAMDIASDSIGDAIWDWLDANANSNCAEFNANWNGPVGIKLVGGCHYIGKVIEIRLPYAFVVQVFTDGGKQWVFVFADRFHPLGPNSPCMERGVSIRSQVRVGDEIVVIPTRNESKDKRKFEWIAKEAWPKGNVPAASGDAKFPNKSSQLNGNNNETHQIQQSSHPVNLKCSFDAKKWKEVSGVILTIHFDWGLVREEVGSGSTYVFKRKNTFLFGLCLENFVLHEVLQEGQLVKFYLENEDFGGMNACELHCGNKLPDVYSFENAAFRYCEERSINFSVEESLVLYGKEMYSKN